MSKNSKRKKRKLRDNEKRKHDSVGEYKNSLENEKSDVNPSGGKPEQEEQSRGVGNFTKRLWLLLVPFAVGVFINKISAPAWAWWIPSLGLCAYLFLFTFKRKILRCLMVPICFLVLWSTHKYIQFESKVGMGDFIEGTQYSRKRLTDIFPFGYAVFFYNQRGRTLIDESTNGIMDWQVFAHKVVINPDFFAGIVTFNIPSVSAKSGNSNLRVGISDSEFNVQLKLKPGYARRAGFLLPNQPVLHVICLSGDQQNPIFAIGFRMPLKGEGRPPGPPDFLIPP